MNFKQNFVSYELAKKVIDAGFDWECCMEYGKIQGIMEIWNVTNSNGEPLSKTPYQISEDSSNYCIAAPMYQQVVDWLRETYGIIIDIVSYVDNYDEGKFQILYYWNATYTSTFEVSDDFTYYSTYEECREAAILFTLNELQN